MGSLRWALPWVAVGAVGLAPILVYWVARLIGRAFRSKRADRRRVAGQPENEGEEQRGRRDTARPG